jgi:hypothetical protein
MHTYLEILIMIGSLGALMWGMMKFMLKDIHKDLQNIRSEMGDLKDGQKRLEARMDKSDSRIDHLYQICVEMLGTRHRH